ASGDADSTIRKTEMKQVFARKELSTGEDPKLRVRVGDGILEELEDAAPELTQQTAAHDWQALAAKVAFYVCGELRSAAHIELLIANGCPVGILQRRVEKTILSPHFFNGRIEL